MEDFKGFGLSATLMQALTRMEYTKPTPIQMQAIPLALKGRDIMGSAQTGTGKTAAFGIPLVEKLLASPDGNALILTPTRELAKQIMGVIHQLLGNNTHIKTAFLIGGEAMGKQFNQLRANPRIVVGTPGRINDHLNRGSLDLKKTSFLVLDETDRMLDMGFSIQLDEILKYLPKQRQTLMFSATLPKNIIKLSEGYLNNPERVSVGSTSNPATKIKQEVIRLNDEDKYGELARQLTDREGSVIVFVGTKFGTERLAKRLNQDEFDADVIHGDLKQNRRDRVIQAFRGKKFRVLVATDVAARGLDIPHIEHVINYDMPQVPEDYIHRIGRTARAGAEGSALCLVSPKDGRKWHAIEQLMNPDMRDKAPPRFAPKTGQKPGAKPWQKSGQRSGAPRSAKPGEKPWVKPAEKSGDKPWHNAKPARGGAEGKPARSGAAKPARSGGPKPAGAFHAKKKPAGKSNFSR